MNRAATRRNHFGLKLRRAFIGGWSTLAALLVVGVVVGSSLYVDRLPAHSSGSVDLNGDGRVDVADLSRLLSGWGSAAGDTNGDGLTNILDLSRLLTAWGGAVAASPTVTPTPAPGGDPSGEAMPLGDLPGWKQVLAQNFTTSATTGTGSTSFKSIYAKSWCGYTNGSGGDKAYTNDSVLSAHDGLMDFNLTNGYGAAGSYGVNGVCGQLYGRFSIRFKAIDATSYGTAMMVWPNSNVWGDGEVDYPEGGFWSTFAMNQHGVGCGNACGANVAQYQTHTAFTNWHTATTEWTPMGVKYYLDGTVLTNVTHDVPINNHRMTIQMATDADRPYIPGHFLVDWVSIYTMN